MGKSEGIQIILSYSILAKIIHASYLIRELMDCAGQRWQEGAEQNVRSKKIRFKKISRLFKLIIFRKKNVESDLRFRFENTFLKTNK